MEHLGPSKVARYFEHKKRLDRPDRLKSAIGTSIVVGGALIGGAGCYGLAAFWASHDEDISHGITRDALVVIGSVAGLYNGASIGTIPAEYIESRPSSKKGSEK